MGQPLAPSVQQMIAQQPALQAQMAQFAVEAANRRNAQAYQGTDQIGQNILKAMGMYGEMQEKKADRATDEQRYQDELAFRNDEATYKRWERQDAAALAQKNRGEDLAFRDAKFEHEKYVQLEKLVLDGNMSAAQIDSMAKAGKLTDVQVERLIQMLPSDVRKGEAGADAAEAGNEEFKNSEPYRRAMEEFSLQQAEANVASTQAGTAATTGAEGRAASMHPFQQRLAANAANMSDQEFSEWMMSKDFRDQKQQFELDQMDANIQGTHATTDSIQSKRWRDEDMAPFELMQAQENILGTRSSTQERNMLLLPRRANIDANTRGLNAGANQSERLLPGQITAGRLGNLQTEEQIRGMAGQEERAQARHVGEMEQQGQATLLGAQQVEAGQRSLDKEANFARAMKDLDLTTPEGRSAAIPAVAEMYPEMLPALIQGDQAALARLAQMQAGARADAQASVAATLNPAAVEAGVRAKVTKSLDAAKKSLVTSQAKPADKFSIPGMKEKEEVELTELVKVYERMLLKLDDPTLYGGGVPAETVFSKLMVQEWGTPPPAAGAGTKGGKDALGKLLPE